MESSESPAGPASDTGARPMEPLLALDSSSGTAWSPCNTPADDPATMGDIVALREGIRRYYATRVDLEKLRARTDPAGFSSKPESTEGAGIGGLLNG